jgi:hypothetical protein
VIRLRLLHFFARRLERLGYACLRGTRRIEAAEMNLWAKQPSLRTGTRPQGEMDTSGSPATGESGGRRDFVLCPRSFLVGKQHALRQFRSTLNST